MPKVITVAGKTLWEIAADELGDATQAIRLAIQNGISDPWDESLRTLTIPDPDPSYSGGGLPPQ
ncbi:hypothetical protein [Rhodovastum atsumiense]|uniref:LysM peptidoglycan-binding domain-containing protein n=1 Tax=Rhodovastum atsumiense TaxID=504468 RepID=A0A5M6IUG7_9PROT|nr:hypothetical protein [Rhodovastum atsumiense]KAA5611881.1 hypothetical protein F1189_12680 [Rhodovastum atsumiense]